jgi:hypothetical protein
MQSMLINLSVLGMLNASDRLGTEGAPSFTIFRPSVWTAVSRRLRGETRSLNVDRIEQTVHHGLAQLRALCHARRTSGLDVVVRDTRPDDEQRAIGQLCHHLTAAAGGLRNLAMTYSDDIAVSARIRALVEVIATNMLNLGVYPDE